MILHKTGLAQSGAERRTVSLEQNQIELQLVSCQVACLMTSINHYMKINFG